MSSNHLLTRYRQSISLSLTSDSPDCVSSPSLEPEAWISRLPAEAPTPRPSNLATQSPNTITIQTPDLFATLLYNREQVYRDNSTPVAPRSAEHSNRERERLTTLIPHIRDSSEPYLSQRVSPTLGQIRPWTGRHRIFSSPVSREEGMAEGKKKRLLVLHLAQKKEAPKVSRPRGRPPKKSTTKSKEKVEENKGKKRPGAEDQQGRASKILRTESKANIGKKVGNSGNQMLAKGAAPEIIEISDSDTGGNPQTNHPVDQDQSSSMFRLLRSWQEPWKAPEVSVPLETDEEATAWHPPLADSPVSSSDLTLGPSLTDNANMVEELHKLRRELQTERDTVHHLRQDIEKRDTNALLEKQKAGTKAKQEVANLTKELEAERQRSREQFQSYKDVLAKQTKLETDYTALEVQLEQEKSARKQEQEIHSEVLQNIIKSNTKEEHMREQVESLQSDKARLVAENEMLKAMAAAPCKIPTLSPVPSSSSSTDEEKREENVRKMYIKVKRQYDILHSVANDLATCTRSMDLSSFGEFGSYMRKLRNSLDMDGTTHTQQTTGVQKTEGDDE